MRVIRWTSVALLAGRLAPPADNTGTDPAYKCAWGENVGWANAGPTNDDVTVHYYEETSGWLSGHAWGENIGWLKEKGKRGQPGKRGKRGQPVMYGKRGQPVMEKGSACDVCRKDLIGAIRCVRT